MLQVNKADIDTHFIYRAGKVTEYIGRPPANKSNSNFSVRLAKIRAEAMLRKQHENDLEMLRGVTKGKKKIGFMWAAFFNPKVKTALREHYAKIKYLEQLLKEEIAVVTTYLPDIINFKGNLLATNSEIYSVNNNTGVLITSVINGYDIQIHNKVVITNTEELFITMETFHNNSIHDSGVLRVFLDKKQAQLYSQTIIKNKITELSALLTD